ncbi:cell division protein FtsA [Buchnera aphidicola str. Bp (Baizongia pistaciae)]|uniref:Cell division protein FtsA n=1 Tax=Buchnera aphidicola subsp. Baizongia pistaciae (strain Bp) TaxID=224915 RepID=FTSA_BUCBP|nr:cell division protein FtsA [Buchnera aphidicola]Q89AQ4.1 RecName: Full=Cell division protein FtsA [Buchnera aphidicola str. Bp (Baizongia pistaciae)]AAO26927.1 cell division protein FtsA [Buchnera aphidicola str. Bp (Baizongia pistaciae)]
MIKVLKKKLIVGLEIGTTKTTISVGEILEDDTINIIGIGLSKSIGIDRGIINDLKSIVECIKKVINQAETMANCNITSIYLALSNKYINCQNEIGIIPILQEEITKNDIENVIHTAKSVRIRNEHKILHIIPQEYSIDERTGIKNPIGLSGIRMQAIVHLITCHSSIKKNIIKAVESCGIRVDYSVFSGLASSESVLTTDERNLGVCIVDIGGGTTDIAIYTNGTLKHSCVIPYAGNTVTNDISYVFNIPFMYAEKIKIKYGYAMQSSDITEEEIKIVNEDNTIIQTFHKDKLTEVIESRYIELLTLINEEIKNTQKKLKKSGRIHKLGAGIVLTGGASNIKLFKNCAEKVFNIPVRIGCPKKNNINTAKLTNNTQTGSLSTVIGLLYFGKKYFYSHRNKNSYNFFKKWLQYINNWIKKEF